MEIVQHNHNQGDVVNMRPPTAEQIDRAAIAAYKEAIETAFKGDAELKPLPASERPLHVWEKQSDACKEHWRRIVLATAVELAK